MKIFKNVRNLKVFTKYKTKLKSRLTVLASCVLLIGLLIGSAACSQQPDDVSDGKLKVVASFYPMYDFAQKIGGDQISLKNLVPGGAEPHSWEPEAADLVSLEQADVFIFNGAGMEHWVDSVLSALQNKDLIVVETAANLDLLAGHDHGSEGEHELEDDAGPDTVQPDNEPSDEAGQDHESEFDPHVWLDPMLAKQQMYSIKEALSEADPDNAGIYAANYENTARQLDELDREFHDSLAEAAKRDIIVAHAAYGYLAAAYDLNQIAISGLSPEQEPDPSRMAEIINLANEQNIGVIFFEELVSPKVAETIAEATGAKTAVLSPLGGLTDQQLADGEDYFSIMRQNLEVLKMALN